MQIFKQRYAKKDTLEPLIWFDFHFTEGTISRLFFARLLLCHRVVLQLLGQRNLNSLSWEMVTDGERSYTFLQRRLGWVGGGLNVKHSLSAVAVRLFVKFLSRWSNCGGASRERAPQSEAFIAKFTPLWWSSPPNFHPLLSPRRPHLQLEFPPYSSWNKIWCTIRRDCRWEARKQRAVWEF